MKCKAIYFILLFFMIFFLSGPSMASTRVSGETSESVTGTQLASSSSPRPAVQGLSEEGSIRKKGPATAATEKSSAFQDKTPPKRLPLAPKSIGLRLLGTVVAENPEMSLAIIEHEGKQRIYYEGKRAGEVLIKKILYGQLIIDAGRGDEVLTMGRQQLSANLDSNHSNGEQTMQETMSGHWGANRHQTIRLDSHEIASLLEDTDKVKQQVELSPHLVYGSPVGIRVTHIKPGSIYEKIGLRNGDMIKGVDDEVITTPSQAEALLRRLKEGNNITIKVKKGMRRTRQIHIEIE